MLKKPSAPKKTTKPSGLHPRNRFCAAYDFESLVVALPELAKHVRQNVLLPQGHPLRLSVDFADPMAVKLLNRALLRHHYGLNWDLPEGYLCPPIPGRVDYIHYVADLFKDEQASGQVLRGLDIGTGANLIYPLLGHQEYGWNFVGSDVDGDALKAAKDVLRQNPGLASEIELRQQKNPNQIFKGIVKENEHFDFCLCNPPFHASRREALEGTQRKLRNLGLETKGTTLNFGGRSHELWCPGGEVAFLTRMIQESAQMPELCTWFTSLVSRSEHVGRLKHQLLGLKAEVRVIEMSQGQKVSRILAWRFRKNVEGKKD